MTYKDFRTKQESIYKDFENAKSSIIVGGLKPKISQQTTLSGYLIICRHKSNVSEKASKFSQMVSEIVPSLIYYPKHIHTTVSAIQIAEHTALDEGLLKKLVQIVNNVKSKSRPFEIDYTKWLINSNSIIAEGHCNEDFFNLADTIVKEASKIDIELRYPYMSHITVSRFFEAINENEKLEKLVKLVDETEPLGVSKINKLEIGFVIHKKGEIDLISGGTVDITNI